MNPEIQKSQTQIMNKTKSVPRHRIKLPNYEEKEKILRESEKKTIYRERTIKLALNLHGFSEIRIITVLHRLAFM